MPQHQAFGGARDVVQGSTLRAHACLGVEWGSAALCSNFGYFPRSTEAYRMHVGKGLCLIKARLDLKVWQTQRKVCSKVTYCVVHRKREEVERKWERKEWR